MRTAAAFFLLTWVCFVFPEQKPFYLSLETPPAPELTPAEALDSFSIAPGFQIELVAAEPLVEDPVAIAWDEAGDMYVVEMRGFMPDAWGRGAEEPIGEVVRLTDTNADGRYDQREVLMDKLVLPRALAIVNEGLLVGEPPNLWLCPGRTGDIDCQNPVLVAEYGNQPGSVEHAENGLLLAIDNWLYSAKSDRRFRFRDGELVVERTLFRGQWGITQDDEGQLYYNTNSNLLLGDVYDAQPVIEAGNSGAPGLRIPVSRGDQVFSIRVNPGVNRAYVPGVLRSDGRLDKPTSASGMTVYRGDQFGPGHSNDVFVTEPAANVVVQLRLDSAGLQAKTEHVLYDDDRWEKRDFLASTDERFRPVDVSVGPDGALYVVDMYRGIIQDQVFLTDQLRQHALSQGLDRPVGLGRVWRISRTDRPASEGAVPAEAGALLKHLDHDNGWQRDTAQRLLVADESSGINGKLRRLIRKGSTRQAVHALWTLEGRAALKRRDVLTALGREDASLSMAALRAGHGLLRRGELLSLVDSEDETISHHATLYVRPFNGEEAVLDKLIGMLNRHQGNDIREAGIRSALRGSEVQFLDLLTANGGDDRQVGFVAEMVTQAFRADRTLGAHFLERVAGLRSLPLQEAILGGLFEVTRVEGFERVVLDAPHPLFTDPPDEIWPAIAKTRLGFTWEGDELVADLKPLSKIEQERREAGRRYYAERCSICHGADGAGIASAGPPLADSEWVTGPAERLLRIILHGLQGPITVKGETWDSVMPGHEAMPDFSDEVASGLMTHLNRAWGHRGRSIEPSFVGEIRDEEAERTDLWTAVELGDVAINTHYRDFNGTYGGGNFTLKFYYENNQLMVQSVFFNGAMVEEGDDKFFFEPREFRIEFVRDNSGQVTSISIPAMGAELPRAGD